MLFTLLHTIQKNLGYRPLRKIDADTQEVKQDPDTPDKDRFSQAAIPAVLTAMHNYSRADEGADTILFGNLATDWTETLFSNKKNEITNEIASYSGHTSAHACSKLNEIIKETISIIREKLIPDAMADIKMVLIGSRDEALLYLPARMQLSSILNDDAPGNRMQKKKGTVPGFLQTLSDTFSGPENIETIILNKKRTL